MIKIYYNRQADISEVDAYFDLNISFEDFDNNCDKYMYMIDKAKRCTDTIDGVLTKYGLCSKDDLSTGLKTLLTIYVLKRQGKVFTINVDGCGSNVLSEIFNLVDNSKVGLIINHVGIPSSGEHTFIVNNKIVCNNELELRECIQDLIRRALKI